MIKTKQKQMALQEKQFRLSMSSMKNQIQEIIKEDLDESIPETQRASASRGDIPLQVNDSFEQRINEFQNKKAIQSYAALQELIKIR